ncbi:hypothetical protein NDU88_003246 [Pleurodeles waltl]|uniref:Uncharacterized protein n=1 Tax=Pleurodeles waltl TaxID=8319 RepID=A0AAV7MU16_PLEWA|nr:hypothetical protein NDU88_003246 [Pleurodeles waltl]
MCGPGGALHRVGGMLEHWGCAGVVQKCPPTYLGSGSSPRGTVYFGPNRHSSKTAGKRTAPEVGRKLTTQFYEGHTFLTLMCSGSNGRPRWPPLFSLEENQEEADIWVRFMTMGQSKGLEWAKKMVAAQRGQHQSETFASTNVDGVQLSDSGLYLRSQESGVAPAKKKIPARATAGSKLKRSKKDMVDLDLPEGPTTSQREWGAKRA